MSTYRISKAENAVPALSIAVLLTLMVCLLLYLFGLETLGAVFFTIGLAGVPVLLGIVLFNIIRYFWKERA